MLLPLPRSKRISAVALGVMMAGCHRAGTWHDDPRNFERIFREPNFKRRLFESKKLRRVESEEEKRPLTELFQEKPSWFLPKPPTNYEVWVYEEKPNSNFRVFIDRQNGDIFLTDFLV